MNGLETIGWLAGLGDGEMSTLQSLSTRHTFAAGETVFAPTPDPQSVYLLQRGRIRILRLSPRGDEVTLGYIMEGEVFGELPGFGDHPRESFAIAGEPSLIWKIPLELFRRLVTTRPEIAIEITQQMGERMKRVESRVENLVFGDVRSRLATVLLELVEDFAPREGDGVRELGLSQRELATLIGSTRQSVNAAMSELRDEGMLRLRSGRAQILDAARLREVARSGGGS